MKFEFLTADRKPCPEGESPARFGFECPKSKNGFMCSGLVIRGNQAGLNPPNAAWAWNGSRDKPTFVPSIDCKGCSHGFIENGVWRTA